MNAYTSCYRCMEKLELEEHIPALDQALEKGWAMITIKEKDILERFFICNNCLASLKEFLEAVS